MIFYFAYGSNMDLKRIEKTGLHLASIRTGKLLGWKLVFNVLNNEKNKSGYANIVPSNGSTGSNVVEGLIYETDRKSMAKLDHLESYPRYYLKKDVIVTSGDGEKIKCVTYVGNQKRVRYGLRPMRIYMKYLLNGQIFLSKNYFKKLSRVKTIDGK